MPRTTAAPADLLTVDQAAERLNVTVRWIRRAIADRALRHYKVGRHVRIAAADLDAMLTAGRREVAPR